MMPSLCQCKLAHGSSKYRTDEGRVPVEGGKGLVTDLDCESGNQHTRCCQEHCEPGPEGLSHCAPAGACS